MNYRASHLGKGKEYHDLFDTNRHRAAMWLWERSVLERIVASRPNNRSSYLDFACGTGRIINHIAPLFDSSVGIDVSKSMLAEAKVNYPKAKYIEGDITLVPDSSPEQFDLITAFRFFPNAEQDLRNLAMKALALRLKPGGMLVFNNHLVKDSASHRAEKLLFINRKKRMMHSEVVSLVQRENLLIDEQFHYGILPLNERFCPLPVNVISAIEGFLVKISGISALAQNSVYVCRKTLN